MRDGWGKRRGSAGFDYSEVKRWANLALKKLRLGADRTVFETLFLSAVACRHPRHNF